MRLSFSLFASVIIATFDALRRKGDSENALVALIVRAKRDKNSRPRGEKAPCLLKKELGAPLRMSLIFFCGERGIRTPGTVTRTTV